MEDQTNFPGHRRPDFAHAPPPQMQGQTPQPPQGAYPGVPAPYQFQQQPQYAPGPHPGAYSMPPLHDQPYGSPPPSTMGAPWAPPQPPQGQHPPGAYNPMFAPPGPSAPSEPQVGMHINPVVAAGVISQAGNMFQGSQAYLQQKMGFLNSGDLQHHFNINAQYVRKKLLLLLTPYLGRWDYTRGTMYSDTGAHGPKQRPPRDDTFAPDLYIPLMAFCTYCILLGLTQMLGGTFKPALMYQNVTSASIAWGVHMLVLKACTSVMHIPPLQYIELACYSGYPFAMIALSIVFGWLLGGWGFYASAGYGALCSAAFLVRTLKKAVWTYYSQINDQPGMSTNYLLLFVGLFQFPFAFFMGMTVPAATA